MNRRPTGSPATASQPPPRKRSDTERRRLRFPCGHVEDQQSVDGWLRASDHAAWVACRRCNVIAVIMAR